MFEEFNRARMARAAHLVWATSTSDLEITWRPVLGEIDEAKHAVLPTWRFLRHRVDAGEVEITFTDAWLPCAYFDARRRLGPEVMHEPGLGACLALEENPHTVSFRFTEKGYDVWLKRALAASAREPATPA